MSRKKLIVANWKMYKTASAAKSFFDAFLPLIEGRARPDDEVIVCPGFPLLPTCADAIRGSRVMLGAQDLFWQPEGAWTGEVSGEMLASVGCTHVIIGHSERRANFCETNQTVNKKIKAALSVGLHAIVCLGESLEERECDSTDWVLKRQYLEGFEGIESGQMQNISIAYEPCWAIGTGRNATPEIAAAAHRILRAEVERSFGEEIAGKVHILYGGSVKPDNARALMSEKEIDGALVGGASLDPQSLASIVKW